MHVDLSNNMTFVKFTLARSLPSLLVLFTLCLLAIGKYVHLQHLVLGSTETYRLVHPSSQIVSFVRLSMTILQT
jgi:hypothetical protein